MTTHLYAALITQGVHAVVHPNIVPLHKAGKFYSLGLTGGVIEHLCSMGRLILSECYYVERDTPAPVPQASDLVLELTGLF